VSRKQTTSPAALALPESRGRRIRFAKDGRWAENSGWTWESAITRTSEMHTTTRQLGRPACGGKFASLQTCPTGGEGLLVHIRQRRLDGLQDLLAVVILHQRDDVEMLQVHRSGIVAERATLACLVQV